MVAVCEADEPTKVKMMDFIGVIQVQHGSLCLLRPPTCEELLLLETTAFFHYEMFATCEYPSLHNVLLCILYVVCLAFFIALKTPVRLFWPPVSRVHPLPPRLGSCLESIPRIGSCIPDAYELSSGFVYSLSGSFRDRIRQHLSTEYIVPDMYFAWIQPPKLR